MKVYVLHIVHRHGTHITVFKTYEAATNALREYCLEWWEECGKPSPPPEATHEIVELYFEENNREWSDITEQVVHD